MSIYKDVLNNVANGARVTEKAAAKQAEKMNEAERQMAEDGNEDISKLMVFLKAPNYVIEKTAKYANRGAQGLLDLTEPKTVSSKSKIPDKIRQAVRRAYRSQAKPLLSSSLKLAPNKGFKDGPEMAELRNKLAKLQEPNKPENSKLSKPPELKLQ